MFSLRGRKLSSKIIDRTMLTSWVYKLRNVSDMRENAFGAKLQLKKIKWLQAKCTLTKSRLT